MPPKKKPPKFGQGMMQDLGILFSAVGGILEKGVANVSTHAEEVFDSVSDWLLQKAKELAQNKPELFDKFIAKFRSMADQLEQFKTEAMNAQAEDQEPGKPDTKPKRTNPPGASRK